MPGCRGRAGGITNALDRLAGLGSLNAVELFQIQQVGSLRQAFAPGQELCPVVEGRHGLKVILQGWAARTRALPDGRRQIISFLIPGDVVSLRERAKGWSATAVTALTPLDAVDIGQLCDQSDGHGGRSALTKACAAGVASEENILLDHVVRLGLQDAIERMAHLFLEFHARLTTVGLVDDGGFELPLTQEHLGEALGMSLVHVNRTLQRMRQSSLIELKRGRLVLLQQTRLRRIAQYEDSADERPAASYRGQRNTGFAAASA
ncbi:Crp/Fnr family transcriptional regulator [soil metagenome]